MKYFLASFVALAVLAPQVALAAYSTEEKLAIIQEKIETLEEKVSTLQNKDSLDALTPKEKRELKKAEKALKKLQKKETAYLKKLAFNIEWMKARLIEIEKTIVTMETLGPDYSKVIKSRSESIEQQKLRIDELFKKELAKLKVEQIDLNYKLGNK